MKKLFLVFVTLSIGVCSANCQISEEPVEVNQTLTNDEGNLRTYLSGVIDNKDFSTPGSCFIIHAAENDTFVVVNEDELSGAAATVLLTQEGTLEEISETTGWKSHGQFIGTEAVEAIASELEQLYPMTKNYVICLQFQEDKSFNVWSKDVD